MKDGNIIPADMDVFLVCTGIAARAWAKGYEEYNRTLGEDLFENIFPSWQNTKADFMEPYFKGSLAKRAYVILKDGEIAGFITCELDTKRKVGTIRNNAVDPEFQGKGLGSKMYNFILDAFRMEGMTAAVVETMDEDAYIPAQKAYEKAGFDKKLKKLTYYRKL